MTTSETYIGAIDLGGTKILSLCLDRDLNVLGRDYRETRDEEGIEAVVGRMVESMRTAAEGRELAGVGISAPGLCRVDTGVVSVAPNLHGWHEVPLVSLVTEKLGVPAWLENDASAAALAEYRLGAGKGSRHLIFIAAGTGVGGGIVIDGKLYVGASGAAGELGHMHLVDDGPACSCGSHGCLESLAGGWALNAVAAELVQREPEGILARIVKDANGQPDAKLLQDASEAGDKEAKAAIRRAGHYFGLALTSLINVFNPEVIAIGGSLRKIGDDYLGVAIDVARQKAFDQSFKDVRIVEAELEDEAPALGAAIVAMESLDR